MKLCDIITTEGYILTNFPLQTCSRCSATLIQVTHHTERLVNTQSSTTITTYRCSDPACQEAIEKKLVELRLRREEQEARALAKVQILAEKRALRQSLLEADKALPQKAK